MSQSEPTLDQEVVACVGFCDPPMLELMHWMRVLPVGSVLAVGSCDPTDARDIPFWLDKVQYEFLGAFPEPEQNYTRFVARKTH